jgi:hypothetical protein
MREAETTTCSISCPKALVPMTDDSANTDDAASNPDLCISTFPSGSRVESGLAVLVSVHRTEGKNRTKSTVQAERLRAA